MMPILLDSTKTVAALVADNTNGIGRLADCTRCEVTEERNGAYTLELDYPVDGVHFSDLKVNGVLRVKANPDDDLQLFRIYKISKPMSGVVTVYANHITYDLTKTSVSPFTSNGAAATCIQLKAHMTGGNDFSISTDISNLTSTFTNKIPQSFRALLGGQEGSMLDVFGGEFKWNNNAVSLLANRGADNGVRIAYGKNLTDIKQEENIENMYTAVMPYIVVDEQAILGDLQTIVETAEPKILNLDLSSEFEISEESIPTKEQINEAAQDYIERNDLTAPSVSISISFVDLSQYEEFKNVAPLLHLGLCDTVHVYYEKLGIEASAKMIKYVYNTLLEKYEKIEIGDAKSTLAQTIIDMPQEAQGMVDQATGYLDSTIAAFSGIIANGLGLFITKIQVGTAGGFQIYLHNKPTLAESQYQWTINDSGFAVSKDYGKTWSAGFTVDGDATFNSLSANAIYALSIFGSVITFGDPEGTNVVANTTSDNAGIQFTGSGKINFRTVGEFRAENAFSNNQTANRFIMSGSSSPSINVQNFKSDASGNLANQIQIYQTSDADFMYFTNYSTEGNTAANGLNMIGQGSWNALQIRNFIPGETDVANSFQLSTANGTSDVQIYNYIPGSANMANRLFMTSSENNTYLALSNYDTSGNERCGLYMGNEGTFWLSSNTGGESRVNSDRGGNLTVQANNSLNLVSENYDVVIRTGGISRNCQWQTIDGVTYLTAK